MFTSIFKSVTEVCPGCWVKFEGVDSPTHRYIGASAACREIYTGSWPGIRRWWFPPWDRWSSTPTRRSTRVTNHRGPRTRPPSTSWCGVDTGSRDGSWPGHPGPGGCGRSRPTGSGYQKLEPAPSTWELTIADVAGAETGTERGLVANRYIRGVWEAWRDLHGGQIEDWRQAARSQMKH